MGRPSTPRQDFGKEVQKLNALQAALTASKGMDKNWTDQTIGLVQTLINRLAKPEYVKD